MSDFEIIDAHTHVYPTAADTEAARGTASPELEQFSFAGDEEDALETMDRTGTRRMVLLPLRNPRAEIASGVAELADEGIEADRERLRAEAGRRWSEYNDWAADVARRRPDRFRAMVGIDPVSLGAEWASAEIERGLANGARGLKIMPAMIGCPPDDERMAVVWEAAHRHELPVVAMCGLTPYTRDAHPDRYDAVAGDYPRVRLILAHAGMGAERATIALARRRRNVQVDTSSWFDQRMYPSWLNRSERRAPFTLDQAAAYLREVGVERVLIGTNWAIFPLDRPLQTVLDMPLTDSERRQIFSENYRRVFDDRS